MTQNGSHRNGFKNGYPGLSSKYGLPPDSEFYDYPPSNDTSTSTEPYFRIILSKKSNTSISTNPIKNGSISTKGTSTTEVSDYFNDLNYDDDYKEDDFRQNLTLFPFLNDTLLAELEKRLYPNISRNSSATAISNVSRLINPTLIHENGTTPTPTSSSPHHNATDIHWSRLIPENASSTTITPIQTPSATSIVTKVLFQTTTVNSFKTNTTPNPRTKVLPETPISPTSTELVRRDQYIETITESQIDAESLHSATLPPPSTTFLYENTISLSSVLNPYGTKQSSTRSSQDLSYLPQPSVSLSLPEPTSKTVRFDLSPIQNNISQPSRLYLPPMQN